MLHKSCWSFTGFHIFDLFKGNCTSNQNWACFVHCLKIINNVLKNDKALWSKLPEKLRNGIKILVGQAGSCVINPNTKHYFDLITPESLDLLKFNAISDFLRHFAYFQNFSWFQFYIYKLCMIMCIGIAP